MVRIYPYSWQWVSTHCLLDFIILDAPPPYAWYTKTKHKVSERFRAALRHYIQVE
jgi:hypothetical protein